MIKILQWIVRIPFTITLLLGLPLIWLISFSMDGVDDANGMAKEFFIEIIKWRM